MPWHSGGELSSEERREICGRCGLDAAVSRCWFCWGYYCRRCERLTCKPAQKPEESQVFQPHLL